MDANKKWTPQRFVQFFAFLLLIVVLPAGSWYYLRTGLDKRLEAKAELLDFGKIQPFSLESTPKSTFTQVNLAGKLALFAFPKTTSTASVFDQKASIVGQFQNRSDVVLLSVVVDSMALAQKIAAVENPKSFKIWNHVADPAGLFSKAMFEKCAASGRQISDEKMIALVDTMGTIRRFYDASDRVEMVKLVNHVGLLLPSRD